jgi:phenylalanyl-tRNA synthetase beta chain
MGGEETEVTERTTNVLLEAANFEPVGILRSSERLKLRTDGSNRWEKGVDPHLAAPAARLCTQLIVEHAGGRWTGEGVAQGELPERPVVRIRPARASSLIGLEVPEPEQRSILERLGFDVAGDWTTTVPTWRARDVTREIDLVEEVARFVLDDVPFTLPRRTAMFGRLSPAQRLRRTVEDVLVGAGFSEAYTWSLVAADPHPGAVELPEPLSADQRLLRTELLPSLVEPARHNHELGFEDVALFEIARVYVPGAERLPDESWHVSGIVVADGDEAAFYRAKGAVETLFGALRLEPRFERGPGGTAVLDAGVVRPLGDATAGFELDLDVLAARVPALPLYEDVITYPAVKQDLAFVVDEGVAAGDLVDAAREAAGPELREMRVFDVYRGDQAGPGRKSLAFRVAFQSPDRTLTDEDAAGLRDRIVRALAERFRATLRA